MGNKKHHLIIPALKLQSDGVRIVFDKTRRLGEYSITKSEKKRQKGVEAFNLLTTIKHHSNGLRQMYVSFDLAIRGVKPSFKDKIDNLFLYDFILDSLGTSRGHSSNGLQSNSFYKLILYYAQPDRNMTKRFEKRVQLFRVGIKFNEVKDKNCELTGIPYSFLRTDKKIRSENIPFENINRVRVQPLYKNPETSRGTETSVQDDDE